MASAPSAGKPWGSDVELCADVGGVGVEVEGDGFDGEGGDVVLPGATGEVGDGDGLAAAEGGLLGEFGEHGPLAGFVDVDVEGFALLEAEAEAQIHEEVHAAVSLSLIHI